MSKDWKRLASEESLWAALVRRLGFGKNQWETYFGDVGEVPPLPKNIFRILSSPCPFWPGKKVEETHILVLIPKTVSGKPLTLVTLGELVERPKKGPAARYKFIAGELINAHGHQATAKAHWAMMTKDVIEGSRNKSYEEQKTLIAKFTKQTELPYEVPNSLDASICIFMHYFGSKERLFNSDNDNWIFTRCKENFQYFYLWAYILCQIKVGGFSSSGLSLGSITIDRDNQAGIAPLVKFF